MKITFEDNGRQVCIELPQDLKAKMATLKDVVPCFTKIDVEVEIFEKTTDDIKAILNTRLPVPGFDVGPDLIRMVLIFMNNIDPGAPIDFWDMWVKYKKVFSGK